MIGQSVLRTTVIAGTCVALTVTGCSFDGINSLPLPGAVGRGSDAQTYHLEIANIGTLESNSPVLLSDVVVGSVGKMTVRDWHADVEISIKPDIVVPANAVATVGQTSLLGSMHISLDPPVGDQPSGRLPSGSTLPLNRSSTYPSTEQTLSSLSAVVNGGGLGQIADIVHNFNSALGGNESQIRDLLVQLNDFVGMLDDQRDDINASIDALNRLAGTFAGQRDTITAALERIPPALDVLVRERPRITTALEKLGTFSDTAAGLINDSQADLVRNLKNLEPTLKALADVGPDLSKAIAFAPTFPYSQSFIDRAIRGDYMNLFMTLDFTIPRLKRTMFLGTRWGEEWAKLVPAPGDPWFGQYTLDPLKAPITAVATPFDDDPALNPPPAAAPEAAASTPEAATAPEAPAPAPETGATAPVTPGPAPDQGGR